jgi:hypothetical protein
MQARAKETGETHLQHPSTPAHSHAALQCAVATVATAAPQDSMGFNGENRYSQDMGTDADSRQETDAQMEDDVLQPAADTGEGPDGADVEVGYNSSSDEEESFSQGLQSSTDSASQSEGDMLGSQQSASVAALLREIDTDA